MFFKRATLFVIIWQPCSFFKSKIEFLAGLKICAANIVYVYITVLLKVHTVPRGKKHAGRGGGSGKVIRILINAANNKFDFGQDRTLKKICQNLFPSITILNIDFLMFFFVLFCFFLLCLFLSQNVLYGVESYGKEKMSWNRQKERKISVMYQHIDFAYFYLFIFHSPFFP